VVSGLWFLVLVSLIRVICVNPWMVSAPDFSLSDLLCLSYSLYHLFIHRLRRLTQMKDTETDTRN
jgi:hypothetical protein